MKTKIVKVKPYQMIKVSDEVIDTIANSHKINPKSRKSVKDFFKEDGDQNKALQYMAIDPDTKNFFTFIPIIEDGKFFMSPFPEPVQIYYSLAYSNYQSSLQARKNVVFRKGKVPQINTANSYSYNWYLKSKIATIIFLHSSVEAFINYILKEDFVYMQEMHGGKSDKFTKQTKEYTKPQTERHINFKEKLKSVITQGTGIDFQKDHQKVYDTLLNLNSLRNDIIHLRSSKDKNQEEFRKVFTNIIGIDLGPFVLGVQEFINTIKPGFIELEEGVIFNEEAKFDFNFEAYGAFRMTIDVFLKILDTPNKYIQLNIPKSTDENFNLVMNFVHQNLNVMAEQQLMFFPIIEETDDKIVFKIVKTDKKLGGN